MVAVLYHSRSLCYFSPAYDLGPQLRRHNIVDSKVPLSPGGYCCRRLAAPCVGQRAVAGPDLHCVLPVSVCITSIRTHRTTWPPHLHMASRTCTWPPHHTSGGHVQEAMCRSPCESKNDPTYPPELSNAPQKTRVPPKMDSSTIILVAPRFEKTAKLLRTSREQYKMFLRGIALVAGRGFLQCTTLIQ